ncbi:MAG: nickel-dependent lactate racemase family protein [Promethearchaeota archaeon]|jgi:nickel-dependent lactate racemase
MKFSYGKKGLDLTLDPKWDTTVIRPNKQSPINDPVKEIQKAISHPLNSLPLKEIIQGKDIINNVCIVVSDATRPVPSHIILEALINELNVYGVRDDQIFLLIATGLHRSSRDYELDRIIGRTLRKRIKTLDHVATDKETLKYMGETADNTPIFINKHYYNSDVKILTGYVEPHFFFGFSGGRKSIIPGIAGEETIQANHSAENIASQHSRFGSFENNLMHQMATKISNKVGVDFVLNVCINAEHEIVSIAAGELEMVQQHLVRFQMQQVFKKISEHFDIVVCGNGGYPLDLNLYQAVKSMAIGEMAVKSGGTIISVNECIDGIGQDNFRELIFSRKTPKELYNQILNKVLIVPDQWEIQILTRILMKADIFVVSELGEKDLGNIGLKNAETVEEAIKIALKKHGKDARILILPSGPQVIPFLK